MNATSSPCHLLALPPELRLHIYTYVYEPIDPDLCFSKLKARLDTQFQLRNTCRLIFEESLPVHTRRLERSTVEFDLKHEALKESMDRAAKMGFHWYFWESLNDLAAKKRHIERQLEVTRKIGRNLPG